MEASSHERKETREASKMKANQSIFTSIFRKKPQP